MSKYIDSEKLIAKLTKMQFDLNAVYRHPQSDSIVKAISLEYDDVISLITSLQQEQPETNMKSPFTSGKVTILSREEEVTFRGEIIKITRKYYRCVDTGREFTDSKLDDDMMWAAFRAYCEKKGMTSFTDIMLKQEQPHFAGIGKMEQPESDLEKAARYVYESWMGGTMDDVRRDMVELGKVLNGRKEE